MNVVVNVNSVSVINKPCVCTRTMRLSALAALRRDREQFIYNLDTGRRPGPGLRKSEGSQTDERKSGQTKGIVMQTKS
jgi:hypothetical protein